MRKELEGECNKSAIKERRAQQYNAVMDAFCLITLLFGYVLYFEATKEELIIFIGLCGGNMLLGQLVENSSFSLSYLLKLALMAIASGAIFRFLASLAI
ncbi:hypothetical protein TUM3794_19820 [Shewanella colwelliana]|uniref:Uncharacterized protein n=1 Tax=Shewanella colwelliana TaxID=23 RepID=A0ABQ4P0H3_SHECO|nr:hypothetical protein [Shewanella colwelliana]GIU40873.1 hypothetical protein TUM3794_19820 [Shewanella colwelliana]